MVVNLQLHVNSNQDDLAESCRKGLLRWACRWCNCIECKQYEVRLCTTRLASFEMQPDTSN